MKKTITFIIFISLVACKSVNVFSSGEVAIHKPTERVEIKYSQNVPLPLVKVEISEKQYTFLFDTGAPTVISSEIYKNLELKPSYKNNVFDSQGNKDKQIFTILPEMKVGNLEYKNIGCVVMDFKDLEFKCIGIDGVLGANQMAFSFWKVDYLNGIAEVSSDLSNFDVSNYDYVFPFFSQPQKTPIIEFSTLGEKRNLTFDTGYNGRFSIIQNDSILSKISNREKYKISGISSLGIYGAGNHSEEYGFKTDEIELGGVIFTDEIIETDKSTVLGNRFLEDFIFVMDWKNNKIYLKRIQDKKEPKKSFGFGSRYVNNNQEVIKVIDKESNPVQLGDIILKINGKSFENLTYDEQCENFLNGIEKNADVLEITIQRNDSIHNFTIEKKLFFE